MRQPLGAAFRELLPGAPPEEQRQADEAPGGEGARGCVRQGRAREKDAQVGTQHACLHAASTPAPPHLLAPSPPPHPPRTHPVAPPPGESFYFRVNGVPLFARGANLIPLAVLPTRAEAGPAAGGGGGVQRLLRAALAANMNMVRVW